MLPKSVLALIQEEKFYEAHQLLLSLTQRNRKQKRFDVAAEALFDGASEFVKAKQYSSADDTLVHLLDLLFEMSTFPNPPALEPWANKFIELLETMKNDENARLSLNAGAKFFKVCSNTNIRLYDLLGDIFAQSKDLRNAQLFYIRGTEESISKLANIAAGIEREEKLNNSEEIAKVILTILSNMDEEEGVRLFKSVECFQKYLAVKSLSSTASEIKHKNLSMSYFSSKPVLNFLQMTLIAARISNPADKGKLYTSLLSRYVNQFPSDCSQLANLVGKKVFNLNIQSAPANPLQAMLQGLLS